MLFSNTKNILFAGLALATLGVGAVTTNSNVATANASAKKVKTVKVVVSEKATYHVSVGVRKSAKGYAYGNKTLSHIKSKNIKKYFKTDKLELQHMEKVSKKGKPQFDYVKNLTHPKKSAWVANSNLYQKSVTKKAKKHAKTQKTSDKDMWKKLQDEMNKDNGSNSSSNTSNSSSNTGEKLYSDGEAISQIKSRFIDFVNQQREANGKSPLVLSDGLQKVANERASYVDTQGDDDLAHYTTADGVKHSQTANYLDGKNMGIFNNKEDMLESNAFTTLGTDDGQIDSDDIGSALESFKEMITADGDSNYGHRNMLIGNDYNGTKYYGLAFRMDAPTNDSAKKLTIEIISSDTNY